MRSVGLEFIIIIVLVCINGFFALSEMAIVSARKVRLEQRAQAGSKGAAKALKLLESPSRFLSTVQIGITLIGILSGAFGGVTLAAALQRTLVKSRPGSVQPGTLGWTGGSFYHLSFAGFWRTASEAYRALNADNLASSLAPVMQMLSVINRPVVAFLSGTTDFILKLFRVNPLLDQV